jgi:hypothetical protein
MILKLYRNKICIYDNQLILNITKIKRKTKYYLKHKNINIIHKEQQYDQRSKIRRSTFEYPKEHVTGLIMCDIHIYYTIT